ASPTTEPPSFFTMLCHQPLSTLFPYTTLFRSSRYRIIPASCSPADDLVLHRPAGAVHRMVRPRDRAPHDRGGGRRFGPQMAALRSEEHTSELQSLAYLVCRLLLEKKKHAWSDS